MSFVFSKRSGTVGVPSQGVPGKGSETSGAMRALDTVIIVEEGSLPYSWCNRCDIMMPWAALNGRHPNTT